MIIEKHVKQKKKKSLKHVLIYIKKSFAHKKYIKKVII